MFKWNHSSTRQFLLILPLCRSDQKSSALLSSLLSKAPSCWPTSPSPNLTSQLPSKPLHYCHMDDEGVRQAPYKRGSGHSQCQPQGALGMYQLAVKCADNAIIYQIHWPYSHLQKLESRMRMMSFDFSGAFNIIQPLLLGEKLKVMQVDSMVFWIMDWLSHWQAAVHLPPGQCIEYTAEQCIQHKDAPGNCIVALEFTLYTFPFKIQVRVMAAQQVIWWLLFCGVHRLGQEKENMTLLKSPSSCYGGTIIISVTKEHKVDFGLLSSKVRRAT